MSRTKIHHLAVSLDGFATGEGQTLEAPFGHAGTRLVEWVFPTRNFTTMHQESGGSAAAHGGHDGTTGLDDIFLSQFPIGIGAEIMGRNKFTPERGPWSDPDWRGWWGDNPPFHTPVFVLTHYPRAPIEMDGGTTFHFIDATPQEALVRAQEAAGGLDVRIGGGPTVVRDFLAADLIDHAHFVIVPIVLGRGVRVWDGLEGLEERFDIESVTTPSGVTHMTLSRTAPKET